MPSQDGGFINPRTGKYVSPERAHQHVGEEHAFGGYEKARSQTTGNYYMRETGSGSDSSALDSYFDALSTLDAIRSTSRAGILGYDGRSA